MAGLLNELVSGVVDSALKEILKKSGTRSTGKRTKRRSTAGTGSKTTRRRTRKSAGGLLAEIVEAALKPARKQVSRRKSSVSRSKTKRRTAR